MGRRKIKPEVVPDEMGVNPFVSGYSEKLSIPVRKLERKVLNKFDEPDISEFFMEATRFTKLYEVAGGKAKMMQLPLRAKEMFLYILFYLESGNEFIWINRYEYMKQNNIRSVNTYKAAILELSYKGFICPHVKLKDVLWINPHHFFKGSRIDKYPAALKVIIKEEVKAVQPTENDKS